MGRNFCRGIIGSLLSWATAARDESFASGIERDLSPALGIVDGGLVGLVGVVYDHGQLLFRFGDGGIKPRPP